MKIRVDQMTTSPSSLRLGCVVEYSENGPVRFMEVQVPWALFDKSVRADLLAQFDKIRDQAYADEPPADPLF